MSTCNRLDLQTLGSQPIMPKNLPDHGVRPSLVLLRLLTSLHFALEFLALELDLFQKVCNAYLNVSLMDSMWNKWLFLSYFIWDVKGAENSNFCCAGAQANDSLKFIYLCILFAMS